MKQQLRKSTGASVSRTFFEARCACECLKCYTSCTSSWYPKEGHANEISMLEDVDVASSQTTAKYT